MRAMQTEVFEAFRAIDVPEDKALRAAAALASAFAKTEDETARSFTKRDGAIDRLGAEVMALGTKLTGEVAKLAAEIAALDKKLSAEIAALDKKLSAEIAALDKKLSAEIAALNAKVVKLDGDVGLLKWMVGFSLAMLVTLLFRSFTH